MDLNLLNHQGALMSTDIPFDEASRLAKDVRDARAVVQWLEHLGRPTLLTDRLAARARLDAAIEAERKYWGD